MVSDRKGKVLAPRHIRFITEMPRTAVGKIDQKVLRAPLRAGQARQVG
jgi:fatty-acyl-CoA synthase